MSKEQTRYINLEKRQRMHERSHTRLKKKLQADIEMKHLKSDSVWPEYCLIKVNNKRVSHTVLIKQSKQYNGEINILPYGIEKKKRDETRKYVV